MSVESPLRLTAVAFGFRASRALMSALDVGLFGELARGPRTLDQLRRKLQLQPQPAEALAEALVALGLLIREGDGPGALYLNAREADRHLDPRHGAYLGNWLRECLRAEGEEWSTWTSALLGRRADAIDAIQTLPGASPEAPVAEHGEGPAPSRRHAFMAALLETPVWTAHAVVVHLSAGDGAAMRDVALRFPSLAARTSRPTPGHGQCPAPDLLVLDLPWPWSTPRLATVLRRAGRDLPPHGAVLLVEEDPAGIDLTTAPARDRPDATAPLATLARSVAGGSTLETSRPRDRLEPLCRQAGLQPPVALLRLGGFTAWYAAAARPRTGTEARGVPT